MKFLLPTLNYNIAIKVQVSWFFINTVFLLKALLLKQMRWCYLDFNENFTSSSLIIAERSKGSFKK